MYFLLFYLLGHYSSRIAFGNIFLNVFCWTYNNTFYIYLISFYVFKMLRINNYILRPNKNRSWFHVSDRPVKNTTNHKHFIDNSHYFAKRTVE